MYFSQLVINAVLEILHDELSACSYIIMYMYVHCILVLGPSHVFQCFMQNVGFGFVHVKR